jgi:hypothetical protein
MKRFLEIVALLALLSGPVAAQEKEKGGGPEDAGDQSAFSVPIPVGHEAKGIKLPWYNEEGGLEMTFSIGTAKRLDDRQLEMKNLEVETYDEAGSPSIHILLPHSVLDLTTRVLSARDEPVIRRKDFEITGEALVFNTRTREGRFTGRTRMLIFDAGSDFVGR